MSTGVAVIAMADSLSSISNLVDILDSRYSMYVGKSFIFSIVGLNTMILGVKLGANEELDFYP